MCHRRLAGLSHRAPSWPCPGSKNVFGRSPSPARVNRLKRLYHFPCGTSGSDASQSCNSSKSAIEIRPSRKRSAKWSMIGPGGGFLILGIPVLFVEYDPLQLVREAADFAFVFGVLQALQADMKGLFGSTEAGVGRRRFAGVTRAAISALGPPCRNRFSGVLAPFFGCEPGRTGWPPFLPPLPAKPIAAGLLCFAAIRRLCARDHRNTAVRSDREECPGLSVRKSAHPCGTGAEVRAVPTPCLASKVVR